MSKKICINMEGRRARGRCVSYSTCALLHEAACVNFTHAMEFFFSDPGEGRVTTIGVA